MRILGIDPSLNHTGYVILNDGKVQTYGLIEPKTKGTTRLYDIKQQLISMINNFGPMDMIVMENYTFHTIARVTFQIGEMGGVMKLALYEAGYPNLTLVSPTTAKKFATGSGRADKNQMGQAVKDKWKFEHKNDNVCDAYVLAEMGHAIDCLSHRDDAYPLLPYEREAIDTVMKSNQNQKIDE